MTKQEMMVEAHRMAKEELEGDYQARLSLALRQLWKKKKGEDKMDQKPVIEDWWLRENPAKETIIKELDMEVTVETDKAVKFDDEVWVPKSVISWGEASSQELEDEEKKEIFLEEYEGAEWYDYQFRREVRKNRDDRNRYAFAYDLAQEKGLI